MLSCLVQDIDCSTCMSNCSNNGLCINAGGNKMSCLCFPNFSGSTCNLYDGFCIPGICINGGKCIEGNDSYNCNCSKGYHGKNCEFQINYCLDYSCSKNGFCKINTTNQTAYCDCFLDYSGFDCSQVSQKLSVIKKIISTASILAILLLILFFATFIIIDISNIFFKIIKPRKKIPNKTSQNVETNSALTVKLEKPVYKNRTDSNLLHVLEQNETFQN